MSWFKKRREPTESIDVDQAIEKANAAKNRLATTRTKVNIMSKFFAERQGENGFGQDFEWSIDVTLDHKPEGA